MPDQDGYPTDEELERLKDWNPKDGNGMLEFMRSLWWPGGDRGIEKRENYTDEHVMRGTVTRWKFSTGGWSGNEDIIYMLMDSAAGTGFWSRYWHSSRRGGHYEFRVPETNRDDS